MQAYHEFDVLATPEAQKLADVVRQQMTNPGARSFQEFERSLREAVMALERRGVSVGLKALDVDVPEIEVDGVTYKREESEPKQYVGLGGGVMVDRHLYKRADASGRTRSICPMELRAGIVEGTWTPCAAEVMAHSVAVMTPYEAEELLGKFGGFTPSRSSLERLPKGLSERWEAHRDMWEEAVRQHECLPFEATQATVSLDGVMVPMRGEEGETLSAAPATGESKKAVKKTVYREASCGTVSLYDRNGERLETAYFGRMPESKKPTLHAQLEGEVACLFRTNPNLLLTLLADGAEENWRILDDVAEKLRALGVTPAEIQRIVDFFHASEHLKTAVDLYYSWDAAKAKGEYEKLRHQLRHEDDGVDKVIRKLVYFRNRLGLGTKARKELTTELGYFRKRREQMRYAEFARKGLPIGTGVTEAACKTVVTQRLKRSGMRWGLEGGQAVLTLRGLLLSSRWAPGWKLLSESYRAKVLIVRRKGHLRVLETLPCAS